MKTTRTAEGHLVVMPEHDDDKDIIKDLENAFKDRVVPFHVWIEDFLNPGLRTSQCGFNSVDILHYIEGYPAKNLILRTVRQAGVSTGLACYALYRALCKEGQTVVLSCNDFVMTRFMLDKLELFYEVLKQSPNYAERGYFLPQCEFEVGEDTTKSVLAFENGSCIVVVFRNSHLPEKSNCVLADDYAYYDEDRGLRLLDLATKMTEGEEDARIVLASSMTADKDKNNWFDKLFYDLRTDKQWNRETYSYMVRKDIRDHVMHNVVEAAIPNFRRNYLCRTKYDDMEQEELEGLLTPNGALREEAAEAAARLVANSEG